MTSYDVEKFVSLTRSYIPHREKLIVIAQKTGLSESTVSRALAGQRVSLESAFSILQAYEIPIRLLID